MQKFTAMRAAVFPLSTKKLREGGGGYPYPPSVRGLRPQWSSSFSFYYGPLVLRAFEKYVFKHISLVLWGHYPLLNWRKKNKIVE